MSAALAAAQAAYDEARVRALAAPTIALGRERWAIADQRMHELMLVDRRERSA